MCPDYGAIDHVGGDVSLHHLCECLQHRVKHAGRNPAPVAPEHAVPFAIFVRQVTPQRSCPGNPHHTFEVAPIVLRRTATAPSLGRQQLRDYGRGPSIQSARRTPPLKGRLESSSGSDVNLCPRSLKWAVRCSGASMPQVTVFSDARRLGDWSDEKRMGILWEAFAPNGIVASAAWWYDISPGLI